MLETLQAIPWSTPKFWIPSFFTSFSENLKARDLFEIFLDYGKVDDVFIPLQRDQNGIRFGFVQFILVNNVEAQHLYW